MFGEALLLMDIQLGNLNSDLRLTKKFKSMSGARVILQVIDILRANKGKYGVAAICNAGGEGSAVLVENLQ